MAEKDPKGRPDQATSTKGQQHDAAKKSEGGDSPAKNEKSGAANNDQSENRPDRR